MDGRGSFFLTGEVSPGPSLDPSSLLPITTSAPPGVEPWVVTSGCDLGVKIVTWLILPVVICLSQRLSHACLSISNLYCEPANGSLMGRSQQQVESCDASKALKLLQPSGLGESAAKLNSLVQRLDYSGWAALAAPGEDIVYHRDRSR